MGEYDEQELKMRSAMFDLAVPVTILLNKFAVVEWLRLQKKYGFSEDDYPALKRIIDNLRNVDSFRALCKNPLVKMSMISNPMMNNEKECDPSEDC